MTEPPGITLGHVSECFELRGVDHTLWDLDAQHLRVHILPLAIRATQQAKSPPLLRRNLAALELVEHLRERVDVGGIGK